MLISLCCSSSNGGGACDQVRVCTHTSCRKSGSLQTLDLLRNLAPPQVSVESCGCLGRCGSGPNLVALPTQVMVSFCSTPAHAARLMEVQCGAADANKNLAALAIRNKADKAVELGDLSTADALYTQAIKMNPSGGLHRMYAKRSSCRLALDDAEAALADAKVAAEMDPKWPQAFIKQAEAYTKLQKLDAALHHCSIALSLDPSLRRSKSFQRKLLYIQNSLSMINAQ